MGSFISSTCDELFFDEDITILITGLKGSGKSTIVDRLEIGTTQFITPALGVHLETTNYRNSNFIILDAGISDEYGINLYLSHLAPKFDAIIYVVDSENEQNMELARIELERLRLYQKTNRAPLLIFANKYDSKNALPLNTLSDKLKLRLMEVPWHIKECNGLTGDGLDKGMEWLGNKLFKNN